MGNNEDGIGERLATLLATGIRIMRNTNDEDGIGESILVNDYY